MLHVNKVIINFTLLHYFFFLKLSIIIISFICWATKAYITAKTGESFSWSCVICMLKKQYIVVGLLANSSLKKWHFLQLFIDTKQTKWLINGINAINKAAILNCESMMIEVCPTFRSKIWASGERFWWCGQVWTQKFLLPSYDEMHH